MAFRPKINHSSPGLAYGGSHNKGCNCKKSNCLKKYCECFQAGILCASHCKCVDCRNRTSEPGMPGDRDASAMVANSPAAKRQAAAPAASPQFINQRLMGSRDRTSDASGADFRPAYSPAPEPPEAVIDPQLARARRAIRKQLGDEIVVNLCSSLVEGTSTSGQPSREQEQEVLSVLHTTLKQVLASAARAGSK